MNLVSTLYRNCRKILYCFQNFCRRKGIGAGCKKNSMRWHRISLAIFVLSCGFGRKDQKCNTCGYCSYCPPLNYKRTEEAKNVVNNGESKVIIEIDDRRKWHQDHNNSKSNSYPFRQGIFFLRCVQARVLWRRTVKTMMMCIIITVIIWSCPSAILRSSQKKMEESQIIALREKNFVSKEFDMSNSLWLLFPVVKYHAISLFTRKILINSFYMWAIYYQLVSKSVASNKKKHGMSISNTVFLLEMKTKSGMCVCWNVCNRRVMLSYVAATEIWNRKICCWTKKIISRWRTLEWPLSSRKGACWKRAVGVRIMLVRRWSG